MRKAVPTVAIALALAGAATLWVGYRPQLFSPFAGVRQPISPSKFQLSKQCPPSFELVDGYSCRFRSLYQLYAANPGGGGLRVSLPPLADGFSPQQIDLGRYLFFDPLLSRNHDLSCATCHQPDRGFSDGRARGARSGGGAQGRGGPPPSRRRAPTLWNSGFLRNLFWDGRAHSLVEQAQGPLFAADEMANSRERLERELNESRDYRQLFSQAFGSELQTGITLPLVIRALSAFESTLISLNSRYDRYAHGDDEALTEQEKRGLNIFRGVTLGCSQCHTPPLFTNDELEVTGIANAPGLPFDPGAGGVAATREFLGAFRTPTLRNIARTAPYMHAGQLSSLTDVVRFYNDRPGHAAPPGVHLKIDWRMALRRPVLSEQDIQDVVAFMLTLTDETMAPEVPAQVPSGLPVVRLPMVGQQAQAVARQ